MQTLSQDIGIILESLAVLLSICYLLVLIFKSWDSGAVKANLAQAQRQFSNELRSLVGVGALISVPKRSLLKQRTV